MKRLVLLLFLFTETILAQNIELDTSHTFQRIHSFGASDCWSMQMVGKYYPIAKRNQIAEFLFSKEMDQNGNPKGIGLSMWRFNIGTGSTEQGIESKITNEWRRAECFLNNGKYDWTKQAGQQWFLDAAKKYGVENKLGFLNSAPASMSKNGLAIGSGEIGDWNFNRSEIDHFTTFLADVSSRLELDYISPFNEPQWDWGPKNESGFGSQEGTSIGNDEIAWATRKIDQKFRSNGIKTKITLSEAGQINYLYASKTNRSATKQDNQIQDFFDQKSKNYLGDLNSVEKIIAGHSYFTTSPANELTKTRESLLEKVKEYQLDYWQSEYCVLGDNAGEINGNRMDLGMETAMYVAKIIHADLTIAHASAWHWWLSVSANDYKDGLIYISNKGIMGENDTNKYSGDLMDSKTLWTLGNYSRFVRPNMQRVKVSLANPDVLISAYKGINEVIVVLINQESSKAVEIPKVWENQQVNAYITSEKNNLSHQKPDKTRIDLLPKSVTTLVISKD